MEKSNKYNPSLFYRSYATTKLSKFTVELSELTEMANKQFFHLERIIDENLQIKLSDLEKFANIFHQISLYGQYLYKKNEFRLAWSLFISKIYNNLQDNLILKFHSLKGSHIVNNSKELVWAESFKNSGFFNFIIDSKSVGQLRSLLVNEEEELYERYRIGRDFSRQNLSINQIPYSTTAKLGAILEQEGVLRAASAGFNSEIICSGFALELSVPEATWWKSKKIPIGQSTPAKTAYFHRDESPLVPKAIIYLSDVRGDNGPFEIVPPSYKSENSPFEAAASRMHYYPINQLRESLPELKEAELFEAFENTLPPSFCIDSHFGFSIPDSSEVSSQILNDSITFCGNAGFGVCFDGYALLHRGGLVTNSTRLALQIMLPALIPSNDVFSNFIRQVGLNEQRYE